MHQYFADEPLTVGCEYIFNKEQAHHAGNVLHLSHERIRLVYNGQGYYAEGYPKDKGFAAMVLEEDNERRELPVKITLALALIRREKMELALQKAAELGASRIVPFVSSRCVVQEKHDRQSRQKERWQTILREASAQCKRDLIPELTDTVKFKDLGRYVSALNLAAYENHFSSGSFISGHTLPGSVTLVIGPEGGFSEEEVRALEAMGYEPVTFGPRILRAETAVFYGLSVLGELAENAQ